MVAVGTRSANLKYQVIIVIQLSNEVLIMHHKWVQAATYISAGVGLVIFFFFEVLPGSFLGRAIGLNLAGKLSALLLCHRFFPRLSLPPQWLSGRYCSALLSRLYLPRSAVWGPLPGAAGRF